MKKDRLSTKKQGGAFLDETVTSATECTGLIPTPPQNDEEAAAYESLYPIHLPGGKSHKKRN